MEVEDQQIQTKTTETEDQRVQVGSTVLQQGTYAIAYILSLIPSLPPPRIYLTVIEVNQDKAWRNLSPWLQDEIWTEVWEQAYIMSSHEGIGQ